MKNISFDELRKILKDLGHSDEEIEEVVSKKEKEETPEEESEEETKEEVEVEAAPEETPVAEEEGEPAPAEEPSTDESGESEGEPVVEPEELPVDEAPVEEAPEVEAEPLPEGVQEVDPEAPVVEEPTPTEPVSSGVDIQSLMERLDESEKAREGLQARIDQLENALKEAGILGEGSFSHKEVGVDDGTRVNDYHDDEQTFDDVLNEINRGY